MANKLEDNFPVVMSDGVVSNKSVDFSGGSGTFKGPTGANSLSGNTSLTGTTNTISPWNFISSETGVNDNSFVVALTDSNGTNVALSLGLVIWVKLGRRLVKDSTATMTFNSVSRAVKSQSGGTRTGQTAITQNVHTNLLTGAYVGFVYADAGWQVIGY